MNYEYKDEILEHIGPEPNCNYQSERDEHYAMVEELDEVYKKAQDFDDLVYLLEDVFKSNERIVDIKGRYFVISEYKWEDN